MKNRPSLTLALLKQKRNPSQILTALALRHALADCKSVLDVGCGTDSTVRELGISQSTGLDAYAPSIEKARQLKTHDKLVLGDVRDLRSNFGPKSFDACVALDVIEHLQKPDGFKLMSEMEQIARKKVVFLTPSGFLPQGNTDADDYQRHYSGWEPAEMKGHGYKVFGLLGPKAWRGEYHQLKYKPSAFWAVASLLAHTFWTRWHPEESAAMLCVKDL
jgi:SAM-dependent methyltransferase